MHEKSSIPFPIINSKLPRRRRICSRCWRPVTTTMTMVVGMGEVLAEAKKQLQLAGPLIAANLLQFVIQVISVMFVGHLGELPLSGASLATSFAGVTGFSVLMGMGTALETLCGQAFGAKEYRMLGIYMQRGMLILVLVSIPLAIIWAFTGQILLAIKQDPQISMEAGLYARWMIPSIFAFALLQCHVKFLQTQNIVIPLMLCSAATTLLHILVCWALVLKSDLGSRGAALANSISYWVNVLLLALYVKFSRTCKSTWPGFSKKAFYDVMDFLKLAIPSAFMVCLEFWSYESLILLSGFLPNPKLETSVVSISLNTSALLFMIPLGLSAAISTRVSNELGGGCPFAARLAVYIVVSIAILEGLIMGMVIILVRGYWGQAYSKETEVVNYVSALMPFVALTHFVDAIQCVISGIVRGCGRQKIGAFVNLGSFYIIGVPTSVLLAFVFHKGGKGLWVGITSALGVQVLLLLLVLLQTNWQKEATKAKERVYSSTVHIDAAA